MKKLVTIVAAIMFATIAQANDNPIIKNVEGAKDFAVNNKVSQFVIQEYNDTVAYQKDSWQQGKDQLADNKEQIVGIFNNVKGAFTHYFGNESQQEVIMKRSYKQGTSSDATYFVGVEVEHTPAYGRKTLFVTGLQSVDEIARQYSKNDCEHIFFGANHSFQPSQDSDYDDWEAMIEPFLNDDICCTLDIPIANAEGMLESSLIEFDNFIPQLRVPIPYIEQFGYNATIKIDDKDFKATNPGVWTHSIHELMDRSKFTPWREYENDDIVDND